MRSGFLFACIQTRRITPCTQIYPRNEEQDLVDFLFRFHTWCAGLCLICYAASSLDLLGSISNLGIQRFAGKLNIHQLRATTREEATRCPKKKLHVTSLLVTHSRYYCCGVYHVLTEPAYTTTVAEQSRLCAYLI